MAKLERLKPWNLCAQHGPLNEVCSSPRTAASSSFHDCVSLLYTKAHLLCTWHYDLQKGKAQETSPIHSNITNPPQRIQNLTRSILIAILSTSQVLIDRVQIRLNLMFSLYTELALHHQVKSHEFGLSEKKFHFIIQEYPKSNPFYCNIATHMNLRNQWQISAPYSTTKLDVSPWYHIY